MNKECPICGGELVDKLVSYTFKRFGQDFTYHKIKAEVCLKCGEKFLDGPSVLKIEQEIESKTVKKVA